VTLTYPALGNRPVILVSVEDLLTGKTFLVPMLLDTGADSTCFPVSLATFFGHDNKHRLVRKSSCCGIGGEVTTYIHSVQISLIHPQKSTKTRHVIAWTSKKPKAEFVEGMKTGIGLLGMDIMKQWKSVAFKNTNTSLVIQISP
jgi:hypothetical protein